MSPSAARHSSCASLVTICYHISCLEREGRSVAQRSRRGARHVKVAAGGTARVGKSELQGGYCANISSQATHRSCAVPWAT